MTITINGANIATQFGLTPIKGTLDNLCKPAEMKSLVTNDNAAIDGVVPVLYNRKTKHRTVSLPFIIRQPNLAVLLQTVDALIVFLQNGAKDSTGAYRTSTRCWLRSSSASTASSTRVSTNTAISTRAEKQLSA